MVRIIYNYRRRLGKVRAEVINHVPILEGSMIPFPISLILCNRWIDDFLKPTRKYLHASPLLLSFFHFLKSPPSLSILFSFFSCVLILIFTLHVRKVCESSNFLIFEFFMNRQHSEWILNPLIPNSNFFFNLRVCFLCVCGQLLFFLHLSIFEVSKCFFHPT